MSKIAENLLAVNGQRVRNQPEPPWLNYSMSKSTNDSQQKSKNSTTTTTAVAAAATQLRPSFRENDSSPTRFYHQVSRNVNALNRSSTKGPLSTSFSLPMQVPVESHRPNTTPLVLEDNIRRTISVKLKSNNRLLNPRVIDLTQSTIFPHKSPRSDIDNSFQQPSFTSEKFTDSSVIMTPSQEERIEPPKIPHRNSQTKINGFQHIVNLGNRHRSSERCRESEYGEETDRTSARIYEYKSPFSEEYDQAIAYQSQLINNSNEWNLKDFYRDVKSPLEPETNTKPVFEKCLKLARLQANTIKWEQRRRQNLTMYNRLLKNPSFESNNPLFTMPPNLSDIKRELRCTQCKHVSCLGNCAPGQEYHQYKRFIPFTSFPSTREQIRCKLGLRSQRSMIDIRPRSEQTNFSPMVVVPLFDDDSTMKPSNKKLSHGFLPGRSFRTPKRETMTYNTSTNKIFI